MTDALRKAIYVEYEERITCFARDIIRIPSQSGAEKAVAEFIERHMIALGYDEVFIDSMGNVVGRIGNGGKSLMFDSHMDTVDVQDGDSWETAPYSGQIKNGRIYGRGSVDMKCALAASVYAPIIARQLGYCAGKTVYATCTVNEEDCDGENLRNLFCEKNIHPNYFVTCEPSSNEIALGHTGKVQAIIRTKGVSAAAARPQNGVNAVYEMAEIIHRVKALNEHLSRSDGAHGTIALSKIASCSASHNAVPSECSIYLDRRMVVGETYDKVKEELDALVAGKDASWEIGVLHSKSWTGKSIEYTPVHEAWAIDEQHELTIACLKAYEAVFGRKHGDFHVWVGGTNAVTPVSMGIPCIGFGPGEDFLSHVINENCIVDEIIMASMFYANLIRMI